MPESTIGHKLFFQLHLFDILLSVYLKPNLNDIWLTFANGFKNPRHKNWFNLSVFLSSNKNQTISTAL